MPQLEEDEWPADEEPTTTEREHLKDGGPERSGSNDEREDRDQDTERFDRAGPGWDTPISGSDTPS
jgi:hypothetical protein